MLVLTRTVNQRVRIDDKIVVTIASVRGTRVKLGIEAPAHVLVLRDELTKEPPTQTTTKASK